MLEKATIARPYAQAVFELASEENTLDQWAGFLERLAAIVSEPLMRSVINNPKLEQAQLVKLIEDLSGDTVFPSAKNFIHVLVAANRLAIGKEIHQLFEAQKANHIGLSQVDVISAYPLSDDQAAEIKAMMSKKLGTQIEINSEVDGQLIGGVIIRAGDSVVDASLRGRLHELSNEFAS